MTFTLIKIPPRFLGGQVKAPTAPHSLHAAGQENYLEPAMMP